MEEAKTSTDAEDKGIIYKVAHLCNFLLHVCSHFLSVVVKLIIKSNFL